MPKYQKQPDTEARDRGFLAHPGQDVTAPSLPPVLPEANTGREEGESLRFLPFGTAAADGGSKGFQNFHRRFPANALIRDALAVHQIGT